MARWGKLSYAQKQTLGAVGKMMQELEMLHEGARLGLAVSGGADSFLMLQIMLMRQRIVPFSFEIMVLHVNPGFDPEAHLPLFSWTVERGLASHFVLTEHGPRAHSDENLKNSACFYCARLRRKALFEMCRSYGLSHLAFAHTADDLAATFFMNIFQTGKVYGMDAKADFFGGGLRVIRPMLFVDKKTVLKAASDFKLPVVENPCPTARHERRTEVENWLQEIYKKNKLFKRNTLNALKRRQLDLHKGLQ
jgi:tRNA(Ile)-lysidine synthase TilS/MesJ